MYPRDFFDTYWRSDLRDEVFVAMPFHDEFARVWEMAVRPAIDEDSGTGLRARRVDASIFSGSIVSDILDGIAHSRLVLADISIASEGRWKGQRNGNVMYEVGLAHAVRQSTEILLIRSDDQPINFDIAHINVHRYSLQNLDQTRHQLSLLIADILIQIRQEKALKVQRAVDHLDTDSIRYLSDLAVHGPFTGPDPKTWGETLIAIGNRDALARLQQLGIIRANLEIVAGKTAFVLTSFGVAVATRIGVVSVAAQSSAPGDAPQAARP
jgi:hypothetical protein